MKHCPSFKFWQTVFSAIAVTSVGLFTVWWFNPFHVPDNFNGIFRIFDVLIFLLVSYIIFHPIIMHVLSWTISSHIKSVKKLKPMPGLKVAFITTIVPKHEPLDLLHKCLPAMVKAHYPHDTWLLDEGDNPEAKQICGFYGVKHFSRFGKSEYNTPVGKFTKTKGGNHNAWYEAFGNNYDIVAQIDTDFVPKSSFLTKTLGYFRNPQIAFVGTPQVYGNIKDSLIARGAAEQQYSFYGPLLTGLSGMNTTLLIGANHVIRVKALKAVDHYSAHITEDLITGMKLHAQGWKSVYVSEPLAIGEGPSTWEAFFNQQMRWAYGCMDILFHHSPKLFKKMGFRRTIYYFFLQQHYFSGLAMALSLLLLSLYFAFGVRAADVDLVKFFGFYSVVLLICWLMSNYLQRYHVYKNSEEQLLLSGSIIGIASWPIWFLAFLSLLRGKRLNYKVTPKGEGAKVRTPLSVFTPHLIFGLTALACLVSSFFTHRQSPIMMFWALSSAFLMLSVPFAETIVETLSRITNISIFVIQGIYNLPYTIQNKFNSRSSENLTFNYGNAAAKMEKTSTEGWRNFITNPTLLDCIFLSLTICMSFMLYTGQIGFYSDDWSFLGNFTISHNQTILGLIQTATTPNTMMRPMQNFYDALLFWLFGVHPLGYQIVNDGVLILTAILFYLILRQLKTPRIVSLAVPLLYILLPNYSTDKFWFAAFQADLSMLLFFFSLYAGLRVFYQKTNRTFLWKALCILGLILSALSYEVTLPLVILNSVIFWNPLRILNKKASSRNSGQGHLAFIILNFIALGYIVAFKAMTTTRLSVLHFPDYIMYIVGSAFKTNFLTLGLNMPGILLKIFESYYHPLVLQLSVIIFVLIFCYLYFLFKKQAARLPSVYGMVKLTILGLVVFLLGYSIFFTNNQIGFSPTGVENRVAIAASVGIALTMVGLIGFISRLLLPSGYAKIMFSLFFAFICTSGFIITNTLAMFWANASYKQQAILSSINHQLPNLPRGSTLILDGVCPYVGPAVVFESQWDLKGALQVMYHNPNINADIVTPRLTYNQRGVHSQIYTFPANYSFRNLYVYNFKNKNIYELNSAKMASMYFQKFDPTRNNNCPPSSAGNGVSIF